MAALNHRADGPALERYGKGWLTVFRLIGRFVVGLLSAAGSR
jgi:hypothetical protein